ncbi:MAG TPA: endolytic transglycosylase MltG [Rhizomicrobium sp.]|nr:endolytic transglycosylase MltG [Rhizomicrobium sp.]
MLRFLAILVVLALIAGGAWFWEQQNWQAAGPSPSYKVVMVKPGDHTATIAENLQKAGVIANADLFRAGLRIRNKQSELKAGEYGFPARASMEDVTAILVAGKSIEYKLTAAEGLTSQMIYDLVKADPVLVGDAGPVPAEGTLLPETYLFTRGMTRAQMLDKMRDAQAKLIDTAWPARVGNLPLKTPQDAIILASIVEKETGIPEERRHIAAVFENRLHLGMKLQSDPTIIYGITRGYPIGRRIRQSEIDARTPYNTYAIPGLPAGPICNPGKDAIMAVLNPAGSDDLYFVANGTGGHVFAATMAEHEKNVANWRKIHDAQH